MSIITFAEYIIEHISLHPHTDYALQIVKETAFRHLICQSIMLACSAIILVTAHIALVLNAECELNPTEHSAPLQHRFSYHRLDQELLLHRSCLPVLQIWLLNVRKSLLAIRISRRILVGSVLPNQTSSLGSYHMSHIKTKYQKIFLRRKTLNK